MSKYTSVSNDYKDTLTYLKNDVPNFRSRDDSLTIKPSKIYESSPIAVCSTKFHSSSGARALPAHDAPGQLRGVGRKNKYEFDTLDWPKNSSWPVPRDAVRDRDSPDRFINAYTFSVGIQQKQKYKDKETDGLVRQTNNLGYFTIIDQTTPWDPLWAPSVDDTHNPHPPNPMIDLTRFKAELFQVEDDPYKYRGATVQCSVDQLNDGCSTNTHDPASGRGRIVPLSLNGANGGGSGGRETLHITGAGFALADKIAAVTLRHSKEDRCDLGFVPAPYNFKFDVFCYDKNTGTADDYLPNPDVGEILVDREFEDKTKKIETGPLESKHGRFYMYFFSAKNSTDLFEECDSTNAETIEECYLKYRNCISNCGITHPPSIDLDLFMALEKTVTLSNDQAVCVRRCRTNEQSNGKVLKVDCGDADSYSRLSCTTPRFDFKAVARTAVVGPTVVYKGCYRMAHVKNAKMERIGGNRALKRKKRKAGGLAFCQLECQRKEMGYDMFGLEGTDCWCGSMDEFPNGALPDEEYCSDECVPVDTSLEKLAPSESAEDEEAAGAYTEIGCYSLEISPVDIVYDLPYELYTTQAMSRDKCSEACKSYDYFSIVGNSRCFCGYYFHRHQKFDVGLMKKGAQTENRSDTCKGRPDKHRTHEVAEEKCDMMCVGNKALGGE